MAIPSNPTNFKATYNGDGMVTVTFTAGAGATSTQLQRWNGTTQVYSNIGSPIPTTQGAYYHDTNLTAAEEYAYRGLSINADGSPRFYSTPSNKVKIINRPAESTNVTAEANSNDSVGVSWTNHPTTIAPIDHHYIFRQSNKDTTFTQINRIAGNLSHYTDSRTEPDSWYRYRTWESNIWAGGAYYMSAVSGIVYTTPTAPSNVSAKWVGNDIVVSWDNDSQIAVNFVVDHSSDNGATWDTMATVGKVVSWKHTTPERGVGHRYRVRSVSPAPAEGSKKYSAWSVSNTVSAQDTPNAPRILGPAYASANTPFMVEYRHNPVTPGVPEGGAETRYRPAGGTWSTPISGSLVPGQSVGNVGVQVRTRTSTSGFGLWSDEAIIEIIAAPSLSVVSPAQSSVLAGPAVSVTWNMDGQIEWEAELLQGGTLVDSRSGTTETGTIFSLEDASSYTVRVRGYNGTLWSNWVSRNFSTSFTAPGQPTFTIIPDPDGLTSSVSATGDSTTVRFELVRRLPGEDWVSAASAPASTSGTADMVDLLPPLWVEYEYAVIAWNSAGGSSVSNAQTTRVERMAVVINYGPGIGEVAVVECDLDINVITERAKTLHEFASRTKPVEIIGSMVKKNATVQGTGSLADAQTSPARWRRAAEAEDFWYRDLYGNSFKCSMGAVSLGHPNTTIYSVGFTVSEVGE